MGECERWIRHLITSIRSELAHPKSADDGLTAMSTDGQDITGAPSPTMIQYSSSDSHDDAMGQEHSANRCYSRPPWREPCACGSNSSQPQLRPLLPWPSELLHNRHLCLLPPLVNGTSPIPEARLQARRSSASKRSMAKRKLMTEDEKERMRLHAEQYPNKKQREIGGESRVVPQGIHEMADMTKAEFGVDRRSVVDHLKRKDGWLTRSQHCVKTFEAKIAFHARRWRRFSRETCEQETLRSQTDSREVDEESGGQGSFS